MIRPLHNRVASLLLAAALASGCQAALSPTRPDGEVDTVIHNAAILKLGQRTLHLHTADGKPLANVAVLIAGRVYQVGPDGGLILGKDATPPTGETALVLAPGYSPVRVPTSGSEADIALEPAAPLAVGKLTPTGGSVKSADGTTALVVPDGLLSADFTPVELSAYQPPVPASGSATGARDALAQKLGATGCDQPLPCAPITTSLGVLVTVDGAIAPGKLQLALDVNALQHDPDPARAAAAARIIQTFAAIDATNNPAWRDALQSDYGIGYTNGVLHFPATIDASAVRDGLVKVEVDGVGVLGTLLEVTIVSAATGYLPPGAAQPGLVPPAGAGQFAGALNPPPGVTGALPPGSTTVSSTLTTGVGVTGGVTGTPLAGASSGPAVTGGNPLIGDGGSGIVANNGAGFIGDRSDKLLTENGAGLLTENGAGIIANNGGSLAGQTRVPFLQELGKYGVLTYTDYPWQGVLVRAVNAFGVPYGTSTATTNNLGNYVLSNVADSAPVVFVEADTLAGYRLAALAKAPASQLVGADLNAATTGITALVADEIQNRRFSNGQINLNGYVDDVSYLQQAFNQQDAAFCVSNKVDQVAAYVRNFFLTHGVRPETLMSTTDLGPAIPFLYHLTVDAAGNVYTIGNNQLNRITPTGANAVLASFTSPLGVAVDGAGNAYVSDSFQNQVFQVPPGGAPSVFAGAAAPGWHASGSTNFADGTAATARFGQPDGLVWGADGKLYVADYYNFRVRRVDPSVGAGSPGFVTTVAGGGPTSPNAIFNPTGVPQPVDGPVASGRFGQFDGIAVAPNGDIFVADINNQRIRKVSNGQVTTLAGGANGLNPGYQDGTAAQALFNYPVALACDSRGYVYVADTGNNCIRIINPNADPASPRFVTTLAGLPAGGNAGGTLAATRFNGPYGIWIDAKGVIYVADQGNQHVRVLK